MCNCKDGCHGAGEEPPIEVVQWSSMNVPCKGLAGYQQLPSHITHQGIVYYRQDLSHDKSYALYCNVQERVLIKLEK